MFNCVAAAIVFRFGGIGLLFALLFSERVASQSHETLLELLHGPFFSAFAALLHGIRIIASCVYLFNRSGSYRKQFDLPTCLLLVTRPLSLL